VEFVSETFEYDGGRQVTVYIPPDPPEAVVFAGDGQIPSDAVTCTGIPSKREDCSYTYRQTSKDEKNLRYKASVSVTWEITWSATTGESGRLPSYIATTDVPIAVAKIQTVGA
jgi:hypothetical protein